MMAKITRIARREIASFSDCKEGYHFKFALVYLTGISMSAPSVLVADRIAFFCIMTGLVRDRD